MKNVERAHFLKQAEKEDNAYMVLILTQMEKTLRTLFRTNLKSLEFGNLSKLDVKVNSNNSKVNL